MTDNDDDDRTPLHWACSKGNFEECKLLLSKEDIDIDITDDLGWTPLMIAVSAGHFNIAKFLIDNHADVNIANKNGQICLHYAASKNNLPLLKLLLENKSQINTRDKFGMAPLHRSVSKGNLPITKELLATKRVIIDILDNEGNTPLHLAADEERVYEFKLLIVNGADLKIINKEKKTPFDLIKNKKVLNTLKEFCDNPSLEDIV